MSSRKRNEVIKTEPQEVTRGEGISAKDRRYTSANGPEVNITEKVTRESKAESKPSGSGTTTGNKKKKRRNKSKGKTMGNNQDEDKRSQDVDSNEVTGDLEVKAPKPVDRKAELQIKTETQEKPLMGGPPSDFNDGVWSPRKRSIMRYKKSDEHMNRGSYISELKDNLKSNASMASVKEDPGRPEVPEKLNMDEKVTLFKYHSSKILMFDQQPSNQSNQASGRLLGHGDLEVFQLHNGDVTYLSCGLSFIYPLLPKLKVLRTNLNQFILPLMNPERYWQITLNTEEHNVVQVLADTLERIVTYQNFYFNSKNNDKTDKLPDSDVQSALRSTDSLSMAHEAISASDDHQADMNSSIPHLKIADKIPDSPPSVPASPPPQMGSDKPIITSTNFAYIPEWSLDKTKPNYSISSAMASFDINKVSQQKGSPKTQNNSLKLHQPRPQLHSKKPKFGNPYSDFQTMHPGVIDERSESSMDSLLDEYEDHITSTKRTSLSKPQKQSTHPKNLRSTRPQSFMAPLPNGRRDDMSKASDEFPRTSLSEYNRVINGAMTRSRKSSVSELYASESNWMEPNHVPKSRSSYSVVSTSYKDSALNSTYRQIYKSLSHRNVNSMLNGEMDVRNSNDADRRSSIKTNEIMEKHYSKRKGNSLNYNHRSHNDRNRYSKINSTNDIRGANGMNLNSSEVYQLISSGSRPSGEIKSRGNGKSNSPGIAARLFGW